MKVENRSTILPMFYDFPGILIGGGKNGGVDKVRIVKELKKKRKRYEGRRNIPMDH